MRRFLLTLTLLTALLCRADRLTVVIDAGHGGHDAGAPGLAVSEKTVNLAVARKLGDALKKEYADGVKIIYTRDADFFVKLGERAAIANRAKADLFVSIHCNSIGDQKRRNQVQGASVYVRGLASSKQASEVAALENSVLELEDNTKIDVSSEETLLSELRWNRNLDESIALADNLLDELVATGGRRRGAVEQNDLAVLKHTSMPAVLVELDYICNSSIEDFLASEAGQKSLAEALCNGIVAYHASKKPAVRKSRTTKADTAPAPRRQSSKAPAQTADDAIRYKVQFYTSTRKLAAGSPQLKGLTDVDRYTDGGIIKYTVGDYATQAEADRRLREVKRLFPDAFVIRTRGGRRIR